jgi:Protein of unknown function (DUF3309)
MSTILLVILILLLLGALPLWPLQLGLGLLSERRTRVARADPHHLVADRPPVSAV